jgi:hypothetical protein
MSWSGVRLPGLAERLPHAAFEQLAADALDDSEQRRAATARAGAAHVASRRVSTTSFSVTSLTQIWASGPRSSTSSLRGPHRDEPRLRAGLADEVVACLDALGALGTGRCPGRACAARRPPRHTDRVVAVLAALHGRPPYADRSRPAAPGRLLALETLEVTVGRADLAIVPLVDP